VAQPGGLLLADRLVSSVACSVHNMSGGRSSGCSRPTTCTCVSGFACPAGAAPRPSAAQQFCTPNQLCPRRCCTATECCSTCATAGTWPSFCRSLKSECVLSAGASVVAGKQVCPSGTCLSSHSESGGKVCDPSLCFYLHPLLMLSASPSPSLVGRTLSITLSSTYTICLPSLSVVVPALRVIGLHYSPAGRTWRSTATTWCAWPPSEATAAAGAGTCCDCAGARPRFAAWAWRNFEKLSEALNPLRLDLAGC